MIGLIPKLNIRYTFRDGFIAFKSIFEFFPSINKNLFYFNHARTGLRIALSALDIPKGSKVAVLVYNCFTVMNAVKIAGFEIEFIDVKDDFTIDENDLLKKKNNFSAIILTHLFGIPNDVEMIKAMCPDIPIIEDCAHSYLSKVDDKVTGSMGDISIFSMGLGKFPSIGPGGYLIVNNTNYLQNVTENYSKLPNPSLTKELVNIFKSFLLGFLHNPIVYRYFSKPVLKNGKKQQDDEIKYKNEESRILRSTLGLFLAKKSNSFKYLKVQQSNAEVILNAFKNNNNTNIISYNPDIENPNCFMFPFLANDRNPIIKEFEKIGIELGTHFTKSISWAKKFGYINENCKNAEKITTQIVICPSHYNLKNKHIKLINKLISTIR